MTEGKRRLLAICRSLTALITAVETAHSREPQQLAPNPGTLTRTVTAVYQATSTLTDLAAADHSQVRTAALTGRLLVPAIQVPASARNTEFYTRAPDRRANELLTAYREAGTASVRASAKTEGIIADHQARDRQPASPARQRIAGRLVPVTAIALREPDPPPGAIERILAELGVTEGELLDRGMALDKAAAITRRVLAAQQPGWTVKLQPVPALADRNLQSQPEPLQAEI